MTDQEKIDKSKNENTANEMRVKAPQHIAARPVGKERSPVAVILLAIVTLGIYAIIYNYCTFEELKNWRGQGWSGMLYLLFQFLFPFPLIALPWLVPAYVGRMYAEDRQEKPISGLTGFWPFLPIIGSIVWLVKVQNNLNRFWQLKSLPA
jgi:hypothetical protein